MNVEKIWNKIKDADGLSRTLGMEFISTPEQDTLKARMAVDDRNKQPFGFLSGGASLALAENLAGVGSMALCPGKMALGINISGNHVKAMPYLWFSFRRSLVSPSGESSRSRLNGSLPWEDGFGNQYKR